MLPILILLAACNSADHQVESLVYLSSRNGNFDLYSNDILGQWEKRITTNEGWDWSPYWNSGMKRLIYYSKDKEENFSVVARSITDDKLDILPNAELNNFKLTPDGKRILFTKEREGSQDIWWCLLDGTEMKQLTQTNGYNGRISISPQGDRLVFISDRSGENELYLLDLETLETRRLTNNHLIEKYASWSPDGRQVAFTMRTADENSKEDIYTIDLYTKEIIQLTQTPYAEQEIAWSPSGKKIAFHGSTDEGDHIYTIDISDGKFIKITSGEAYHGEPAWVPLEL